TGSTTLGASGPGDCSVLANLSAPADGFIDVEGAIYSFFCFGGSGGSQFEDQTLEIRANDVLLKSLTPPQNGLFLATPVDLSMEQILGDLGLAPIADQTFTLTVNRIAPACQGDYGTSPYPLFRAEVTTIGPEAPEVEIDLASELAYWETHPFAVVVGLNGLVDKGSPPGGAAVSLTAVGATLDPAAGETDDQGLFESTLIIDHQATEVVLTATVSAPDYPTVTVEHAASVLRGRVVGVENRSEARVSASAGAAGLVSDSDRLDAISDNFSSFAGSLSASAGSDEYSASASNSFALIFLPGLGEDEILSVAANGSTSTMESQEHPQADRSNASAITDLDFFFDVVDHPVVLHAQGNMSIVPAGRVQDSRIWIFPDGGSPNDNVLDDPGAVHAFTLDDRVVLEPGRYRFELESSPNTGFSQEAPVSASYNVNVEFNPPWGTDGG
nr:hypothetical protein [Xanthomonadales bacterium]